jgi:hypothetical protein
MDTRKNTRNIRTGGGMRKIQYIGAAGENE